MGITTMADCKNTSTPDKPDLDLKFKATHEPLDPKAKRFDIFLIDTGWNTSVSKVVHSHLGMFFNLEKQDAFYVLSPAQSVEVIRSASRLIGHDPIMLGRRPSCSAQSKDPRLPWIPCQPRPDQAS